MEFAKRAMRLDESPGLMREEKDFSEGWLSAAVREVYFPIMLRLGDQWRR
jgi:hypothetical protein